MRKTLVRILKNGEVGAKHQISVVFSFVLRNVRGPLMINLSDETENLLCHSYTVKNRN